MTEADSRRFIQPSDHHGLEAPTDGGPRPRKARARVGAPRRREHTAEEIAAAQAVYARVDELPQEEHPGLNDREREYIADAKATREMLDAVHAMELREASTTTG